MKISKLYLVEDGFLYLGEVPENHYHQHYALQLMVSLEQNFVLQSQGQDWATPGCFIPSQLPHCLLEAPSVVLLLVFPTSKLGQYCQSNFSSTSVQPLSSSIQGSLLQLGKEYSHREVVGTEEMEAAYYQWKQKHLASNYSFLEMDGRIQTILAWLQESIAQPVPAATAAQQVHLSTSRFLHLFRKETGITYRRMQLWMKLVQAYKQLEKAKNLTTLAHAVGFSDSAHLSRTFKETFGLSPSLLV